MTARTTKPTGGEDGFTLLEILMAMIILAVGGVGVLSLFAAAVGLQYDSVIDQRKALILSDISSDAQQVMNAHAPVKEQMLPPDIEKVPAEQYARDFEYSVKFSGAGMFPPGEGAVAEITLFYRGNPLEPVRRIFQRTVFSQQEIEKSISYQQDKQRDAAAQAKKSREPEDDGNPK
jgi:prepilin-type N-terminal cleavage/methylation domain-containing protein